MTLLRPKQAHFANYSREASATRAAAAPNAHGGAADEQRGDPARKRVVDVREVDAQHGGDRHGEQHAGDAPAAAPPVWQHSSPLLQWSGPKPRVASSAGQLSHT